MMKPGLLLIVILCVSTFIYAEAQHNSEPIQPLSNTGLATDRARVDLGRLIFSDVRLSQNNSVSCATCHDLSRGGVDGRVRSIGIYGEVGEKNALTVFNSGYNSRLFWDGHAKSLEQVVQEQVQNPDDMGSDWRDVVDKIKSDANLSARFSKIYSDGVTADNIKNAVAIFVRSLVTRNARFDKWLRGDEEAINDQEKRGYVKFKTFQCTSCHDGVNVGGSGLRPVNQLTLRVPSLRNVALTAPYYHDGSVGSLDQAVILMGRSQSKQSLADDDVQDIVAFLKTLTGVSSFK